NVRSGIPGARFPDRAGSRSSKTQIERSSTLWWCTNCQRIGHSRHMDEQIHSLMLSAERVFSTIDPITADFTYIRLLGDRKAIEVKTTVWNQVVEDRTASMTSWVDVCQMLQ